MRWRPGDSVALRELWRGRVWSAIPATIVDDGDRLQLFYVPPGTTRKEPLGSDGGWLTLPTTTDWVLGDRTWDPPRAVLSFAFAREAHAVLLFWDGSWNPLHWYVNLQEPLHRTGIGFDYADHVLDVIASPDLSSWRWKDEEELAEAVVRGLFSAGDAHAFRAEGERAVGRLLGREPPFDRDWTTWRPDPAWSLPELPPGWEVV